jgi:hypothetical protein
MKAVTERQQHLLDLEHSLGVFERKPGALAEAKPLSTGAKEGVG